MATCTERRSLEARTGAAMFSRWLLMEPLPCLHDFNVTDGFSPEGGLSLGTDGNFYGTTAGGGSHSGGTIFKITPSGTLTTIYNFNSATDGGFPHNSPVTGNDGKLYGTNLTGSNSRVYKVTTAGVYTVLVTLGLECDGPLLLAQDGKFYGVTQVGGTFNRGSFFSVTSSGVLKTIFSFNDPTELCPSGQSCKRAMATSTARPRPAAV